MLHSLKQFSLRPEDFALDELLRQKPLPTLSQIEEVLALDGYLNDRPFNIAYIAQRVEFALQKNNQPSRYTEFKDKLDLCPDGQASYAVYEKIGMEILSYLFSPSISFSKYQSETGDEVHRRDAIYRNNRVGLFWTRIVERFQADFIIVDFKNHKAPLTPIEFEDPAKYTGYSLGNFVIVVSRQGGNNNVVILQDRLMHRRTLPVCMIVVSDAQLLDMVSIKENGEDPSRVLEEQYDCLLLR